VDKIPNLMRPNQVDATEAEIQRLEGQLTQPSLQDPGMARKQLNALKRTMYEQAPHMFEGSEVDWQVRRAKDLEEELKEGMPTQAEMRKNPPGAVSKHMNWEKRNQQKIQEWKHIKLRLNAGNNDPDAANMERFRPVGGAQELSMDNAQIPGKLYNLPPGPITPAVIMSDSESKLLKALDPGLHAQMAVLDNETREKILALVRGSTEEEKLSPVEDKAEALKLRGRKVKATSSIAA